MKRPVIVTDHAVVRYFERVLGFDADAVREEIKRTAAAGVAAGARSVAKDGFVYMLKPDGTVTTIVEAGSPVQARMSANCRRGREHRLKDRSRRRGRPDIEPDAEMVD